MVLGTHLCPNNEGIEIVLHVITMCVSNTNLCGFKGCFTYTLNPNRNRTETVMATEVHRFVFCRPFIYEPNLWTKS